MPGDFMVLGAAGKMGLHVCLMLRRALDENHDTRRVIAVSRFSKPEARAEFESRGIETLPCDLCDAEQLARLPDAPNIIFMAGAKFGTADNPGLLKQMNEDMPAMVAERFAQARITAFSTGCVYSFQAVDSAGASEISETNPIGAYAQSCLGREMAFRKVAQTHGTRVALIRLNYSVEFRYGLPRDLAARLGNLLDREPVIIGEEADTAWISDASLSHRLFGLPETSLDQMLEWIAAWQSAELPTLNKPTGFEKRDGNF